MIRKMVLLAGVIAVTSGASVARERQDIDPDLLAYIEQVESDTGTTRFGSVVLGELEGGESETVSITVDPSTTTFITLICGPSCLEITGVAKDASGREIGRPMSAGLEAVIQAPQGSSPLVSVTVQMQSCDWDSCPYAIQAFTRPGG